MASQDGPTPPNTEQANMAVVDAGHGQAVTQLARNLKLLDITMVGVGAMIGAGIFALVGIAAGAAGPGLILAFCLNGVLTLLTAMVYAEIGSAIPGAGGGYLWVKFGLPGPCAFLAGWMDWLAHAVAGALYAAVFGVYLVWAMQTIFGWGEVGPVTDPHSAGTLFGMDAIWFSKGLTLLVCLFFIWVNYRGSSETGKAGNIITLAKIVVIGIFIIFGLVTMINGGAFGEGLSTSSVASKFTPLLPNGFGGVLVAMGLTFIAFEGYEIIVQAGEEVVEPRRNIPRAVFLSLLIVIPIYILVAVVCLGAISIPEQELLITQSGIEQGWLASETWQYMASLGELGVATAANQFMPWGTGAILLVIGAVLSTMSALNATTYSSTRVSFAMGRDRYLPPAMATISSKTRTPVVALCASGSIIILTALLLPVETVAAATCVLFLLVFAAVNLSSITIRRKYGDKLRFGFVTPAFPVIPIISVIGQAAVAAFLFVYVPISLVIALGWIAIGLVLYYTYSRKQEHDYRASPVIFEHKDLAPESNSRILVPVANPRTKGPLLNLASRLAGWEEGSCSIIVLHVVHVPEQLPYASAGRFISEARAVVNEGLEELHNKGSNGAGLVRLSRIPSQSIVETIEERKIDTLVMGWAGPRSRHTSLARRRGLFIGDEVDSVLAEADANTIVLRGTLPSDPKRILIPCANPDQVRYSVQVAEMIAGSETVIELLRIMRPNTEDEFTDEELLAEIFGDATVVNSTPIRNLKIEITRKSERGIVVPISEAAKKADVLILGAASETWLTRRSFTHLHFAVASQYDGPLLMVKMKTGRAKFALQKVIDFFLSREPVK